ncbi:zinc-binding dehydrogenase [Aquincola tertiaricarbonis]|uniref:zinc-binding dehydrogenase n=1 Tax=Aquincola tertiaricarbonis TaxID=391953 RepID=UPI000614E272|nr:zinc-binding dehydrogenase [Aquincola tertiaricarbonis]
MRAYTMQERDGELQLQLQEMPMPSPGAGQLLLRMRAAGLNRGEFIAGHGLHAAGGGAKPVGTEAAGAVVSLGPDVKDWQEGDRVMGRCRGAFAEYVLMDTREALPVPAALDWTRAGAVPLTFLVVYDMLVLQGRLQPGQNLLIAGVTSGVGTTALQAAKAMGARVIGTSGSADKLQRLQTLGLDLGLHTRQPDFADKVMAATDGQGVHLAIDTVGGTVFAECIKSLAFEGRLAMVGYVDGVLTAQLDLEALHSKRLCLFGVSNKLRTPQQRAEPVAGFKRDWLPWMAEGRLSPVVDQVFTFDHLQQAKACMEGGSQVGKLVLQGPAD